MVTTSQLQTAITKLDAAIKAETARALAAEDALLQRIAALETPAPPPTTDLPGWKLVFEDTFDRTVAKGHILDGSPDGSHTADGRYTVFKPTWTDTSKHGTYGDSSIISIANGMLDMEFYSDANGWGHTCVLTCQPTGGSAKGGIVGGRSLIRVRADRVVGFKGVPLWWADAATTNDLLMLYGEIDWPESSFDKTPKAYMHRTNSSVLNDQYYASAPTGTTWQDWHEYVTEWRPGQSVEFFIDGVSIGKTTDRVPTTAMHFNLQFETATGEPAPAPNLRGHIQIDRVALWAPA